MRDRIRERCDVILEPPELLDDVLGDEVGPRRGDLPELHEGGAEPLEGVSKPDSEGLRVCALRTQTTADRLKTPQAGDVEGVVEALVGENPYDLAVPVEVLYAACDSRC